MKPKADRPKTGVLLVDDHPVVRAGYQRLLDASGDIEVVGEASDADAGYFAWQRLQPAVTVTDLSLPGPSGLDLIRRIRIRDVSARVLVFSVHATEAAVGRALACGAIGFVSKRAEPAVLREAVRAAAGGLPYFSDDLRPFLHQERANSGSEIARRLSAREFEVFRLLALGHSLAECATHLHLSEKTVANYQALIKDKLGVTTSAALVHLAMRVGLIDPSTGRNSTY